MSTTRFISDLHFSHKNIIRYDDRPFGDADEMDRAMVELWNETVGKDDLTYILGDVSWAKPERTVELVSSLNGEKVLVRGNHDTDKLLVPELRRCFASVENYIDIATNGPERHIILSHYPIVFFDRCMRGAVHFYGHVHNSYQWDMTEQMRRMTGANNDGVEFRMYNVGCMMSYIDYTPRTLDEITIGYNNWRKDNV